MTLTMADSFFSLSKMLASSCSTVSCLLGTDVQMRTAFANPPTRAAPSGAGDFISCLRETELVGCLLFERGEERVGL